MKRTFLFTIVIVALVLAAFAAQPVVAQGGSQMKWTLRQAASLGATDVPLAIGPAYALMNSPMKFVGDGWVAVADPAARVLLVDAQNLTGWTNGAIVATDPLCWSNCIAKEVPGKFQVTWSQVVEGGTLTVSFVFDDARSLVTISQVFQKNPWSW